MRETVAFPKDAVHDRILTLILVLTASIWYGFFSVLTLSYQSEGTRELNQGKVVDDRKLTDVAM